jgi:membrane associated rhomboid family serine protease
MSWGWSVGAAAGAGGWVPPGRGGRGENRGRGDGGGDAHGGRAGRAAAARLRRGAPGGSGASGASGCRGGSGARARAHRAPGARTSARGALERGDLAALSRCLRDVASRAAPVAGVSGLALASSAYLTPPPRRPYHGSLTSGDPNRACTDALLWATGAGYALQLLTGHAFTNLGAKVNAQIAAGQLWRLVTPMFLHGSVVHLAVNCMSLHNLGPVVERQFGRDQFWAIYVGSAVGGNFLSYKFCPNNAVGASSAIFGLVGAMGVYLHRHRDLFGEYGERQLHNLLGSVGLNAAFGMMSKRIDNYAHLGGLLAGAAVAFLVGPNLIVVDPDDRVKGMARIGRRAVVNRPLLQTYSGEFAKEFWSDEGK